ncbi:MAG: SDR family NAD(P)-dependent oxidoreductase [Sumerlaeia bacterium]
MPNQSLWIRRGIVLVIDALLLFIAWRLAYDLRFGDELSLEINSPYQTQRNLLSPWVVLFQLGIFGAFRLYLTNFRYTGIPELKRLLFATGIGFVLFALFNMLLERQEMFFDLPLANVSATSSHVLRIPWQIIPLYFIVGFLLTAGFRFSGRLWFESRSQLSPNAPATIIVGTSSNCLLLNRQIHSWSEKDVTEARFRPVGFVVLDETPLEKNIGGVESVRGLQGLPQLLEKTDARVVLLSGEGASQQLLAEIVDLCKGRGIRLLVVPSLADIDDEKVQIRSLKRVKIEDLLFRPTVDQLLPESRQYLRGKRVLVTGAGGSIGRELVRQILLNKPEIIILVGRGENSLHEVLSQFQGEREKLQTVVCDIRQTRQLAEVYERFRPEVVFHAAAHKHVTLMEHQPLEALSNNVFGTVAAAQLAHDFECERFVLISTDKAVRPFSVMGATKRLAEEMVFSLSQESRTLFSVVRFGNVLGSRGSALHVFERQIESRQPITITDPEATRFFMTVEEAVSLVLRAGSGNETGSLYLLEMGDAIKIGHLVENLLSLSGIPTSERPPLQIIGLQPGEKQHEELLTQEEDATATELEKVWKAKPKLFLTEKRNTFLLKLERILEEGTAPLAIRFLIENVPGYSASNLIPPDSAEALNRFQNTQRAADSAFVEDSEPLNLPAQDESSEVDEALSTSELLDSVDEVEFQISAEPTADPESTAEQSEDGFDFATSDNATSDNATIDHASTENIFPDNNLSGNTLPDSAFQPDESETAELFSVEPEPDDSAAEQSSADSDNDPSTSEVVSMLAEELEEALELPEEFAEQTPQDFVPGEVTDELLSKNPDEFIGDLFDSLPDVDRDSAQSDSADAPIFTQEEFSDHANHPSVQDEDLTEDLLQQDDEGNTRQLQTPANTSAFTPQMENADWPSQESDGETTAQAGATPQEVPEPVIIELNQSDNDEDLAPQEELDASGAQQFPGNDGDERSITETPKAFSVHSDEIPETLNDDLLEVTDQIPLPGAQTTDHNFEQFADQNVEDESAVQELSDLLEAEFTQNLTDENRLQLEPQPQHWESESILESEFGFVESSSMAESEPQSQHHSEEQMNEKSDWKSELNPLPEIEGEPTSSSPKNENLPKEFADDFANSALEFEENDQNPEEALTPKADGVVDSNLSLGQTTENALPDENQQLQAPEPKASLPPQAPEAQVPQPEAPNHHEPEVEAHSYITETKDLYNMSEPSAITCVFIAPLDGVSPEDRKELFQHLATRLASSSKLILTGVSDKSVLPESLHSRTTLLPSSISGDAARFNAAVNAAQANSLLITIGAHVRLNMDFCDRITEFAAHNSDAYVLYPNYTEDKNGKEETIKLHEHAGCPHERFDFGAMIIYRTDAIKEVGMFDESLKHAWEYDMQLKIMENGLIKNVPHVLYRHKIVEVDDSKSGALHSPGRGKLGGFSYVFYPEDVEKEITSVFEKGLKRIGAWIDHDFADVPQPAEKPVVLASVVIPILNRVKYIENAINKVQNGTFQDFEVIIVDNGSTDGTLELIKRLAQEDSRIRLFNGTGGSIASALNHGIREARGKYICQLDSDDEYAPTTLEKMIGHLENNPKCGLAISYYRLMNEQGVIVEDVAPITHSGYSRNQILRRDGGGAVRIFPKAVLQEFGLYDEVNYGNFGEDYDMVLKTGEKYSVDRVHEVLYHYRRHEDNTDVTRDPEMKYKNKNRSRQEALRRRMAINKELKKA